MQKMQFFNTVIEYIFCRYMQIPKKFKGLLTFETTSLVSLKKKDIAFDTTLRDVR
ncbi:hypothetical protein GWE_00615 [Chlamydia psittaci NJ1]|nr:hypothetical protein B602_0441 [Chlamydia psittaci M56]KPZ38359.1 hypothetical protein GWE_00615 [Chlamydia psittaci NJ1]